MIKKNNKEVGFIEKGTTNIDKIYKGTNLVIEQGFIREDSGVPPLTTSHEAIGKDLKNYKVYGNSIQDGTPTPSSPIEIESVGDKSKNLFDAELFNQNKVNNKRKDNNGNIVNDSVSNYSDYYISVKSNTQYTLYLIGQQGYYEYDENKNFTSRTVFSSVNMKTFTTSSTTKFIQIQYNKKNLDTTNAQLEIGSTATSYEPYGYKIPITVSDGANSSTANIYLDEPLRKIGDYADYIDYKEQKVYRNVIVNDDSGEQTIENSYSGTTDTTGTSVTLPNISSLVGTTTYDVDTKVKPSNMYIKYKGR